MLILLAGAYITDQIHESTALLTTKARFLAEVRDLGFGNSSWEDIAVKFDTQALGYSLNIFYGTKDPQYPTMQCDSGLYPQLRAGECKK